MQMKKMAATMAIAAIVGAGALALAQNSPNSYPADNSGRNQRDAGGTTQTADKQSNEKGDVAITQAVRRAVTSDSSLSIEAQNVKIITNAGIVTLRGPVKDEQEKTSIAAKAKSVSGVVRVDNQLEVAAR
ncbi:MAG TPA: BON domain-containing protein [Candidatus Binatia bacterium]